MLFWNAVAVYVERLLLDGNHEKLFPLSSFLFPLPSPLSPLL
jgi:hypothetical protein